MGRGPPVTPHLSSGRDQHPRLPDPPTQSLLPKPDSGGVVLGKGEGWALVWTGTTPTEAVQTDRRSLIPWRRAGVVSGSCSCSSTGAGLRPQVAGRPRPGGHVSASCGPGATLTHVPLRDWALYLPGIQDGGGGRDSGPTEAAIGETQALRADGWPPSPLREFPVGRWAFSCLTLHVSNQGGFTNPSLTAWEGPRREQGTPNSPPGRPFPIWGLYLGNDQSWESAPTNPGRS